MSDLPIQELEIKLAFLERHIEEQDKVIYSLRNNVEKMQSTLSRLSEKVDNSQADGPDFPADEKPPHY